MNTEKIEEASEINPLDEPVNIKDYTMSNVNTAGADLNSPIGQPSFIPPPFKGRGTAASNGASSNGTSNSGAKDFGGKSFGGQANPGNGSNNRSSAPPPPKPEPMNPEMKNLSRKDTKLAAEAAAKLILGGYEFLHVMANKLLPVSEKKLNRLSANGEINLNVMIDYDYGHKIQAGEFIKEYNHQVSNMLTVSDEFKEEVTPLLVQVLEKRGIGLTPEQELAFLFMKDAGAKSIIMFQQRAQVRHMIDAIKEATAGQYAPPPSPPPPPPGPAQNTQPVTPPPSDPAGSSAAIITPPPPEHMEPEEKPAGKMSVVKRSDTPGGKRNSRNNGK